MKKSFKVLGLILLLTFGSFGLSSFGDKNQPAGKNINFPYKKAGLTDRQAAAHLLSRFTFGAKPGQVDEVVNMGLEKWLLQQLKADLTDQQVEKALADYKTLKLSNQEIASTFPKGGQLVKMAIKDGIIDKDAVNKDDANRREYKKKLDEYMSQKGLGNQGDLYRELINQKIIRAAYTPNQLQEVLTSFWFNHFNVSLTKNDCSHFVTAYERDVIRPNVLGKFETLLLATAKSPAMLSYLDNFKSAAPDEKAMAVQNYRQQKALQYLQKRQAADTSMQNMEVMDKIKKARAAQGLNENYAREIMELHTLGVDGGYTQSDVTQAARVLTGWTIAPMGLDGYQGRQANKAAALKYMEKQGFKKDGDFLFAANRHDNGEKVVLGTKFPAGGGYEEGVKLINMLADHPSTARFISTKLAVRFVSDQPAKSLIDKMAKTFKDTNGDISKVLITMASAPEFWSKESLREKTKSPFELAISSMRSLDAEIQNPTALYGWITKMGEKMYYYQAPTGFPDRGQYWINTGSLLNRMNFGLSLASGRIPGVKINLAALNKNREPESAEAALVTYSKYLMPERNLDETIKRLTPSLHDPEFVKKVDAAAAKNAPPAEQNMMEPTQDMMAADTKPEKLRTKPSKKNNGKRDYTTTDMQSATGNNTMLAQVVGIIIGSPEFQRK